MAEDLQIPKLESIYFAYNCKAIDGSEEFHISLFNEKLKEYELDTFKPRLHGQPLGKYWTQLPKVFCGTRADEVDSMQWRRMTLDVRAIASCIEYNFSDGLSVNSRDIAVHPYGRNLPEEILPRPVDAFKKTSFHLESGPNSHFFSYEQHEVLAVIANILKGIADYKQKNDLPFYWKIHSRASFGVLAKSIVGGLESGLTWDLQIQNSGAFDAKVRLAPDKSLICCPDFIFSIEDSRMVFGSLFDLMKESVSTFGRTKAIRTLPSASGFEYQVSSQQVLRILLDFLGREKWRIQIPGGTHSGSIEKSILDINQMGDFQLFHSLEFKKSEHEPGRKLIIAGFSAKMIILLKTMGFGLPWLIEEEAKNLATYRGKKRERELRLFRHLGVLNYIVYEVGNALFENNQELDEEWIQSIKIELWEKMEPKIAALVSPTEPNEPLSQQISSGVYKTFQDFVFEFLLGKLDEECVYSPDGEIRIQNVFLREYRMLYNLLKKEAERSQGGLFTKVKSAFVPALVGEHNLVEGQIALAAVDPEKFDAPILHIESSQVSATRTAQVRLSLSDLQPLTEHSFELRLSGKPLLELEEQAFTVEFELSDAKASEMDPNFRDDLNRGTKIDWFELNPIIFLNGQRIEASMMEHFGGNGVLEYQGQLYIVPARRLPSLKRLEMFWEKVLATKTAAKVHRFGDRVFAIPKNQVLELLALRASGFPVKGDARWKELCAFYDSLNGSDRAELKIPTSIRASLMDYQKIGVQWLMDLYQLGLGALLADDMGLGKTLQALSFLEILRTKEKLGPCLVLVPSSLIYNWQSECGKFTPELPIEIFANKNKEEIYSRVQANQDIVVICTYGLLSEHAAFLKQMSWNIVIFDEAQNLKNITAKRTSAARSIESKFKICMTGTPMENHYGEYYSLMDLAVPGSLGSIDEFRSRYVHNLSISYEDIQNLKLVTKPLLLRRTKREILHQLPEKQETKVSIAFEEKQKRIYRDVALSFNEQIQKSIATEGESKTQLKMLTALLRLRQICSDPAGVPNTKYTEVPPKIETLLESMQEIVDSGESALVFTQFIATLEKTKDTLKKAGITVFSIDGSTTSKRRKEILAEFDAYENGCVLLMTLKTGGVGLNLTKASYVFHLEPWWNPAVENQATDRVHRMGQTKRVQVFRYIMHESLEEKIELLKDRKDRSFQALFSGLESEREIGKSEIPGLEDSRSVPQGKGLYLSKNDFDFLLGLN